MTNLKNTLNELIEDTHEPTIILDDNYTIVAINDAYQKHYNKPVHIGTSKCYEISHQLTSPCSNNGEACPLEQCTQTRRKHNVLHVHKNKGKEEYCDIFMSPFVVENKQYFIETLKLVDIADTTGKPGKLIGQTPAFKRLISTINKVAKTDINVLLHGETGTGKELVAAAIHQASPRANKPFVIVECTGLNEALFESELFGHEKGAFTGAHHAKKGLVELANEGTLFLDEIGDVPLNIQVKLLRLLETGSYRRVGSTQLQTTNFRLICASHKNIEQLVDKQLFREDLYYRIASFPVELPSLKQRQADITILAKHFLQQSEFKDKKFTEQALVLLQKLPYKGNIRELKNIVERLAVLADDDFIDADLIVSLYSAELKEVSSTKQDHADILEQEIVTLKEAEALYIQAVIKSFPEKSKEEIAQLLDISPRTLYRKLNH